MTESQENPAPEAETVLRLPVLPLYEPVVFPRMMQSVKELIAKYIHLRGNIPADALSTVRDVEDPAWLADLVGYMPELEPDERKELLTTLDVRERLMRAHALLTEQVEVLELKS